MKKLFVVFLVSIMILMLSSVAMAAKIKGVLISKPKPSGKKYIQINPGATPVIKITIIIPGQKYVDTIVKISHRIRTIYLRRNRSAFKALLKARHDSMMATINNIR